MKRETPRWIQRLRDRQSAKAYDEAAAYYFKLGEQGLALRRLMGESYTCSAGYDHAREPCPFHSSYLGMGASRNPS